MARAAAADAHIPMQWLKFRSNIETGESARRSALRPRPSVLPSPAYHNKGVWCTPLSQKSGLSPPDEKNCVPFLGRLDSRPSGYDERPPLSVPGRDDELPHERNLQEKMAQSRKISPRFRPFWGPTRGLTRIHPHGPRRALDRSPTASRRIRGVAGCSIGQRDRGHPLAENVYNRILAWSGVIADAAGCSLG